MELFESVNRLLQDKHTLTEAKTVLRVTFDNGMKKDIEFKGSFEAGKKAYLGKNVKAISKDKTPIMLKAVKVESINESKENNEFGISDLALKELQHFGSALWVDMFSGPEGKQFRKDVQSAMDELVSKKYVDRKETGSDTHEKKYIYKITKKGIKFLKDNEKNLPERLPNLKESKDLEPMKTFKVTYHDGSSYKTSARAKSEEDFKKYLTQDGPWVVTDEDDETGKETKKKIVKVEMLKESKDENELEIEESMDSEVHTFDKPMDLFRQINKESQAIYVKEKDGKIEGRYNPKPKKDWILVDGFSASKAVKLYDAASEEQKAKIDKLSLTRFLNALWK